ncbi:MAG: hypothetical protein ABI780_01040 [Ardenticatenales bacterium]
MTHLGSIVGGVLRRRGARTAIGLLLAVAALVVVVQQLSHDIGRVADTLRTAFHLAPAWLAAAWIVQTAGAWLMLDTWRRIVESLGVQARPAQHAKRYAFAALAHVVPGGIWVPLGRLAAYGRADALAVGAGMTVEWVVLGVAGLVLYGATLPLTAGAPPAGVLALVAAGALGIAAVQPAVFRRLVGLAARLMGRQADGAALPALPAGALRGWQVRALGVLVLSGVALYAFMRAVSPAPPGVLAEAVGIGALTLALGNLLGPLPLAGLVKDIGMVLLFTPIYGSSAIALGVVVAWRLWLIAVEVSWALIAMVWHRRTVPAVGMGMP